MYYIIRKITLGGYLESLGNNLYYIIRKITLGGYLESLGNNLYYIIRKIILGGYLESLGNNLYYIIRKIILGGYLESCGNIYSTIFGPKYTKVDKLGHSCAGVTKGRLYESRVRDHVVVQLGLNVNISAHDCGCVVNGGNAMAAI